MSPGEALGILLRIRDRMEADLFAVARGGKLTPERLAAFDDELTALAKGADCLMRCPHGADSSANK